MVCLWRTLRRFQSVSCIAQSRSVSSYPSYPRSEQCSPEELSMLGSAPMMMEEEVKELPTKIVSEHLSLLPLAHVELFDVSGNTNKHFMQHFLSYIQPRTLILVNGSDTMHDAYRQIATGSCPQLRSAGRVLSPKRGEKIELDGDLSSYEIAVNRDLIKKARWQQSGHHMHLAWIQGQMHRPDPSKVRQIPSPFTVSRFSSLSCPRRQNFSSSQLSKRCTRRQRVSTLAIVVCLTFEMLFVPSSWIPNLLRDVSSARRIFASDWTVLSRL